MNVEPTTNQTGEIRVPSQDFGTAAEVPERIFTESWVSGAAGAQSNAAPPPPEDPPAEEDGPSEVPRIWLRRDGDATTPEEEEPLDPTPTPKPADERPKLFERDPKPTDGDPPDDGPVVGGPKGRPEIWTDRVRDTDEDGDGVPDGRFDPNDPIMTDEPSLSDVVNGGPPVRSTVSAGHDQSSGTLDRPDEDSLGNVEIQDVVASGGPAGDRLGNVEIQDVVASGAGDGEVSPAGVDGLQLPDGDGVRERFSDREAGSFVLEDDIAPRAPIAAVAVDVQVESSPPEGPSEDPTPPEPSTDQSAAVAPLRSQEVRPVEPVAQISSGLDGAEVSGISGGLDGGDVAGISGGLDGGEDQQISGGLDGGEESFDG